MNTRIMTKWTTKEFIWWDDATDNKPNNTYFSSFENRMITNNNMKVMQRDYANIEVVVPDTTITYIKIHDGTHKYFYYFNKVLAVLPNGYRLEYTLDVFTTFTLPYIKYLKDNNIKLKVNRHKRFELIGLQWEDDMIKAIPKIVANRSWNLSRTKYWTISTEDNSKMVMEQIWRTNDKITVKNTPISAIERLANVTIYVSYSGDDGIYLIPALLKGEGRDIDYQIGTSKADAVVNTEPNEIVKKLVDLGFGAKVNGLYMGPPFYMIEEMEVVVLNHTKFLMVKLPPGGLLIKDNTGFYPLGELPKYLMQRAPKSLNETGHTLSMYAANAINISIDGKKQPIFPLIQPNLNNNLYFGELAHLTFTTNINLLIRSSYYPMTTMLMNYPADLPMFIDKYQVYLQNTKATRDTSLSIAQQNADLNTGFGVAGGLLSAVGGIVSGNPLGVVNSIFSTAQGVTKNIIGLQQKKDMLNAELADKQASVKNVVQSGVLEDAAIAAYILSKSDIDYVETKFYMGDFIEFDRFNGDTTEAINNVLYLYGQFNPKIDTLSNLTAQTIDGVAPKFDYYQLDPEYLSNIFATTVRLTPSLPIQREYYNSIYSHLTNGLRLWKERPEY